MPDSVISLLIQVPIVGIFVWFILTWTKRLDKKAGERDQQWMEFLREERDQRKEFLREEREKNRELLKEEREKRSENASRLAEEIKSIAQEVNRMNGMLTAHDASSRTRAEQGRPTTGMLKPKDP
jgi:uncharacterized membrane protein